MSILNCNDHYDNDHYDSDHYDSDRQDVIGVSKWVARLRPLHEEAPVDVEFERVIAGNVEHCSYRRLINRYLFSEIGVDVV